jgi:NAD(P)-dependent dehydrogenase (short-subunit alcohol dehydrogenase family)
MIPALLNNLLVPWMAPSSSILYVGSTLSEMAVPGCASYVISKHAIVGLMRATCQDLTSQGIHTACICPGITHTSMLETRCDEDPKQLEALKKVSLPERFVEPEEIADVLWFAAQHPVINGSVIHGNLGQKTT